MCGFGIDGTAQHNVNVPLAARTKKERPPTRLKKATAVRVGLERTIKRAIAERNESDAIFWRRGIMVAPSIPAVGRTDEEQGIRPGSFR